jgi:hypothetical protein
VNADHIIDMAEAIGFPGSRIVIERSLSACEDSSHRWIVEVSQSGQMGQRVVADTGATPEAAIERIETTLRQKLAAFVDKHDGEARRYRAVLESLLTGSVDK